MGWTKRDVSTFDEPIEMEKGDSYEGKYLGAIEVDTVQGTNILHRFEDSDGTTRSLWGAVRLNKGLKGAEGAQVRIEYEGKEKIGNGRSVKVYEIYVDEATIPVAGAPSSSPSAARADDYEEEPF